MTTFLIKQVKPSNQGSNNYQLIVNQEILLDNVSFSVCTDHVYKNIKFGDNYQEQDLNEHAPRECSYDEVMNTKQREEQFDLGK